MPPAESQPISANLSRVLFVDQTGQLGGAELCLRDLVFRRGRGTDRVLLFQSGPFEAELREAGINVAICELDDRAATLRKESGPAQKIAAAGGLLALVIKVASQARSFDVVYANTAKAFVVSAVAGMLARRPVIYHLHDILSVEHFSRSNLRLLVSLANRMASEVIANSQASADAFVDAGGDPDKVTVIYNGFEVGRAHLNPAHINEVQSDQYRRELVAQLVGTSKPTARVAAGIATKNETAAMAEPGGLATEVDTESPLIAVFGRLSPWKGQHIAIQAMESVPHAHLLLVGDALFGEQDYVEEIHQIAEDHGVRDRIHFLGFRTDVEELMRASDVVVHCSTSPEPFGRVIVEAMLARRPVIASNAGGAAEIINDGETGILTPMGDAAELSIAINRILDDPQLATALADSGYADAVSRFRIDDRVTETNAVIDRTLS